ncbi:MAG: TRAP transporter TatT component family protein [Spirochaetia bacterium]
MRTARIHLILFFSGLVLLSGCSVDRMIVEKLADTLSSGMGTAFTGEDDPELVGDALPFALKLYDSLLEQTPNHANLLLSTGSAYIMYANAFIQTKAEMLPETEFEEKERMLKRAKHLYLRGRDMVLKSLEVTYPGFNAYLTERKYDKAFAPVKKQDTGKLYWAAAGWFAAFSADSFDLDLSISVGTAEKMMQKALALDETYNYGAIHDFYILFYGSMPAGRGFSEAKAREQFARSIEITQGKSASPYVNLAASICIRNQNREEFITLLNKALAVDPDAVPEIRLLNIITQRKAAWYLKHIDDFFI